MGIAGFVEAWEIVLTMSVSRAVSRDSTSLVTMLNAPFLAPPNRPGISRPAPLLVPKAILRVAIGGSSVDHLDPANKAVRVQQVLFSLLLTRPARFTTGGKAQNASCSFFLERFCVFGFQRVAGRRPSLVQESILPPSRPRIPPTSLNLRGEFLGYSCKLPHRRCNSRSAY